MVDQKNEIYSIDSVIIIWNLEFVHAFEVMMVNGNILYNVFLQIKLIIH